MKNNNANPLANAFQWPTSEVYHREQINAIVCGVRTELHTRKTKEEHEKTKRAIRSHPAKNHCPTLLRVS